MCNQSLRSHVVHFFTSIGVFHNVLCLSFSICSQLAFICVVYPCLILTYMGQAAFLSRNRHEIDWNFYKAVPSKQATFLYMYTESFFGLLSLKDMQTMRCRTSVLASICGGYSCIYCCQPGNYLSNLFYHQAVFSFGLFSSCENCSYFSQHNRPNLHSGDQLDAHDILLGHHHWVP